MHPLRSLRTYLRAVPSLLFVTVLTSVVITLCGACLGRIARWALASQGRVALTTGDFMFLFTSWQGLLLLVLGLSMLYLAFAFDLNTKIAFASHWLRGEDASVHRCMREGVGSMVRFLCPSGVLVVLYIALLAPIVGTGVSLTLTERLKVPTFITSVIEATPLYQVVYGLALVSFALLGFLGIFCVHGVAIDGLSVREARLRSSQLVRSHWADYLLQTLLFAVGALVVYVLIAALVSAAFLVGEAVLLDNMQNERFLLLLSVLFAYAIMSLGLILIHPLTIMKMTERYLTYTGGEVVHTAARGRGHRLLRVATCVGFLVLIGALAWVGDHRFDELFPQESSVRLIAHRACGNEGVENSVAGLEVAEQLGVWGAEIDIQRTADGAYVVNHDTTFKRVAGDKRRPSEMTLAEVRSLTIADASGSGGQGVPVATYEEMLEAARGKTTLFVELKGKTADSRMADDAVRIAREHDMLDQCVFISLKYELIDYLETSHPEAQTGFLAFASYGDTGALNCDYLALEEQAATSDAIEAIHGQGKRALVWTVNDEVAQEHFLCSQADAIITDNISQAERVREEIAQRTDLERIVGTVFAGL